MRPDHTRTPAARRAVPLAVLGAGAMLALSACGTSDLDASTAWDGARAQLEDASSLRMVTEVSGDSGTAQGPDRTELAGSLEDPETAFTAEYRMDGDVLRGELRLVDGTRYERYVADHVGGVSGEDRPAYAQKWTASAADAQGAQSFALGPVVDELLKGLPAQGGLDGAEADAAPIRRGGEDATRYVLDQPVAGQGDSGTRLQAFTVANDDGALLTVETVTSGSVTTTTFSDWDAVEPVEAPPADDVAQATPSAG